METGLQAEGVMNQVTIGANVVSDRIMTVRGHKDKETAPILRVTTLGMEATVTAATAVLITEMTLAERRKARAPSKIPSASHYVGY